MASLFRMYSQISKLYTPPGRNFKNFPVKKNIIFNILYIYIYIYIYIYTFSISILHSQGEYV